MHRNEFVHHVGHLPRIITLHCVMNIRSNYTVVQKAFKMLA